MNKFQIDILPRLFHFKKPAGTSRGVYTFRQSWLLRITSPDMPVRTAWGECAPLPALSCDDRPDYANVLREICDETQQSGTLDNRKWQDFPSMLFGLETALRHWQTGRFALWDTPFSRGEEGICINGLIWMGDYESMYRQIETKMAAGYRCIKLKIGAIDFDKELQLIEFIRSHFDKEEIELRVDANGAFKPSEAMSKLEALSKFDLHSIEQPIRQGQWDEMARLCASTPLPIALDEELIGVNKKSEKICLLETIRPQYIILKPSLHGGIAGSEEWIRLAKERNIGYWITSALESNVGLNAIAQWTATQEHNLPQGLGTGLLFTDNIESPLHIEGEKLWFDAEKKVDILL